MNSSSKVVCRWYHLQYVEESVQRREVLAEPLSLPCNCYNNAWFGSRVKWISRQLLPVIKHTLWEGLSSSVGTKVTCESCKDVEEEKGMRMQVEVYMRREEGKWAEKGVKRG